MTIRWQGGYRKRDARPAASQSLATRSPRSLIWFTVWSSVVHGAVMAVQSVIYPQHIGHLWGDVTALFVVAGVLAFLMPRGSTSMVQRAA